MNTDKTQLRVIILGATSGIAEATARLYAAEGASIVLAGRNVARLSQIADDLRVRGAQGCAVETVDLAAEADASSRLNQMISGLGGVDHILIAYGILGDQGQAETNWLHAADIIDVNFRSTAAWTLASANALAKNPTGALVVLGSVAGDRGRRANYVYGAAKAGTAVLVEGIAHRFAGKGPRIVVVKPGPTDTPMTAGMIKGGLLWSKPEAIARIVRAAADKGGPVVYAPGFWRWIMLIIRNLPAVIFNKLNI